MTWTACCLGIAAFFISSGFKETQASFIQYSNAYAEHVYDKVNSNQIILESFAALTGALDGSGQETTRYAKQVIARHPHILSFGMVSTANLSDDGVFMTQYPGAKDTLHNVLIHAADHKGQVSTPPFTLPQGNLAYLTYQTVPAPSRKPASLVNATKKSSRDKFIVSMQVDASKMVNPENLPLPANYSLAVYQTGADEVASQPLRLVEPVYSTTEKFLFPTFKLKKEIGSSLAISLEKQLGWADLNLAFLSMLALATLASSLMLVNSIRTHYTRRQADRKSKQDLWFLANHDALTQLPNRNLFMNRVEQAIARAHRQGSHFGILFIDLNGFKHINDTHGHAAGDQTLQLVAIRLQACIRAEDSVARLGGDEFVVLLEGVTDEVVMENAAHKIRLSLAKSFSISNHQLALGASIGKATYPMHGQHADDLLRHADADMYRQKHSANMTSNRQPRYSKSASNVLHIA